MSTKPFDPKSAMRVQGGLLAVTSVATIAAAFMGAEVAQRARDGKYHDSRNGFDEDIQIAAGVAGAVGLIGALVGFVTLFRPIPPGVTVITQQSDGTQLVEQGAPAPTQQ